MAKIGWKNWTGLAAGFSMLAGGYAYQSTGFDPLEEELNTRKSELEKQFSEVKKILGDDYVGRCLTGNQVRAIADGSRAPALTDNQKLLVKMFQERRKTAMGRYINVSQKDFNTITCIENSQGAGHLGLYADWANVATVNLGLINNGHPATAKEVMGDPRLFNLAMRTAYEEMAHAWQGNTQKSIEPPQSHPLHRAMWILAVEAQAKLFTFMALQEHRERGDDGPWNDAISGRTTDKAQMDALQKVLDANPGMKMTDIARDKPEALCSVFKAFFTDPMPRKLYEGFIVRWAMQTRSAEPVTDEVFKRERGAMPGISQNFLEGCKISINDPEIVTFFDKGAEGAIKGAMKRVGADPKKFGLE